MWRIEGIEKASRFLRFSAGSINLICNYISWIFILLFIIYLHHQKEYPHKNYRLLTIFISALPFLGLLFLLILLIKQCICSICYISSEILVHLSEWIMFHIYSCLPYDDAMLFCISSRAGKFETTRKNGDTLTYL